jgi:alcohol dehydrogenase class IV
MEQIAYLDKPFSESLSEIISKHNPKRVLLVTGKESFVHSGAKEICDQLLRAHEVCIFDNFSPNPKLEDIEKGIAMMRETSPDLVLAIGGGSAIDIAKSIAILAVHDENPAVYIQGEAPLTEKGVMVVAVPTTAGTGAEATHFAAVYIGPKKYSLAQAHMMPDYAIVDSALTHSLSPRQTALSGVDALCQAIESMWSIHSTDESKEYAAEALELILSNLRKAVLDPDRSSRSALARAAHLAGRAINISKTTACHAMSYALTVQFGIPHGQAVSLTLPQLLRFNDSVSSDDVMDTRGVAYVQSVLANIKTFLGSQSIDEAVCVYEKLIKDIDLSLRLSDFGVEKEHIEGLVEAMSIERAGNNPRRFTKADAGRTLYAIL